MKRVGQAIGGDVIGLGKLWLYFQIVIKLHKAGKDHLNGFSRGGILYLTGIEC